MIRKSTQSDCAGVLALYLSVAANPGGLARRSEEVSYDYVQHFWEQAQAGGLQFVFELEGEILAEIHAARPAIACFSHVLGDLTIAVSPRCQGQGIGRKLFQALLDEVTVEMPHILRVELFARESNGRALDLYRSLGFVEEGRLRARVRTPDGKMEDDLIMGWVRR